MSVVKINAITVPKERAEELEARFAARAGEVSASPGFEAFELLRPTDDRDDVPRVHAVASEDDFQNWMNSPAFEHGHQAHETQGPVSSHSELWPFDVVQHEDAPADLSLPACLRRCSTSTRSGATSRSAPTRSPACSRSSRGGAKAARPVAVDRHDRRRGRC